MGNTHFYPLLGRMTPDSSGLVTPVPHSDVSTNALYDITPLAYADPGTTRNGAHGQFVVPKNYSSAAATTKIIIRWNAVATTGVVAWDFDYDASAVGETLDPSAADQTANVDDSPGGTTLLQQEAIITLTEGNFVAGDLVQFALFRDGTDADDTMADVAAVYDVFFQYDDAA